MPRLQKRQFLKYRQFGSVSSLKPRFFQIGAFFRLHYSTINTSPQKSPFQGLFQFLGDTNMNDSLDVLLGGGNETLKSTGFIDDLGFLGSAKLPEAVKQAGAIRVRGNHDYIDLVPTPDHAYIFSKPLVKALQFFAEGGRPLALTGDTGTGKTKLVEEFCARTNWPLLSFSSHDRATMFELIGGFRLIDGNMVWSNGPLITAMRIGGVLLLDEINIMPAQVLTGLNLILERLQYHIPETNELVKAHPDFRIAVTGNAINGEARGSYAGVGKMNIAFLNRFTLGVEVEYLTIEQENLMLKNRFPKLADKVSELIANVASASRIGFKSGEYRFPISSRGTIAMASTLSSYTGGMDDPEKIEQLQLNLFWEVLDMVVTWAFNNSEKQAFRGSVDLQAKTLGVEKDIQTAFSTIKK
jgi:cobaltochelatase CobS